jgi:hypothetical protein
MNSAETWPFTVRIEDYEGLLADPDRRGVALRLPMTHPLAVRLGLLLVRAERAYRKALAKVEHRDYVDEYHHLYTLTRKVAKKGADIVTLSGEPTSWVIEDIRATAYGEHGSIEFHVQLRGIGETVATYGVDPTTLLSVTHGHGL